MKCSWLIVSHNLESLNTFIHLSAIRTVDHSTVIWNDTETINNATACGALWYTGCCHPTILPLPNLVAVVRSLISSICVNEKRHDHIYVWWNYWLAFSRWLYAEPYWCAQFIWGVVNGFSSFQSRIKLCSIVVAIDVSNLCTWFCTQLLNCGVILYSLHFVRRRTRLCCFLCWNFVLNSLSFDVR